MIDLCIPTAGDPRLLERSWAAAAQELRRDARFATAKLVDDLGGRSSVREVAQRLGFDLIVGAGMGAGAARNLGACAGDAAWILFADDDVEFDPGALGHFADAAASCAEDLGAIMGVMRPPQGAPSWLVRAYRNETFNAASESASSGRIPGVALSSALLLVRRSAFVRVGGFPEFPGAGVEDSVLGLRLEALGLAVFRDASIASTHWNVPTHPEWVTKRRRHGELVALAEERLAPAEALRLTRGYGLATASVGLKRVLARIPLPVLARLRGPVIDRLAAAAALTQGYQAAHRSVEWGA